MAGTLQARYNTLATKRANTVTRAEQYAKWTLPTVFAEAGATQDTEQQLDAQSIGARAVNHLSNKYVMNLFNPSRSFFRLDIDEQFSAQLEAAKISEAQQQLAMSRAEKVAMKKFGKRGGRTSMVEAMKLLLITGNALLMSRDEDRFQVYSIRNYVLVRDLSGTVLEIITNDQKALMTLPADLRAKVMAADPKLKDSDNVDLYTQILMQDDGKWHVTQDVAGEALGGEPGIYPKNKCPWIPMAWNLTRGHDYGTGLVEDYAGDFHALSTLSMAMTRGAAIAADIKFLVDPAGSTDYKMLNSTDSGAYVPGRKEDISCLQIDKANDWNMVLSIIASYEKRIGLAFLLGSAATRNAERVTAEEIRYQANELETSHGGVYSRLGEEVQLPLAYLLLAGSKLNLGNAGEIEPSIITGMDALSRNGDLEALQLYFQDLALLASLPEPVQKRMRFGEVMALFASARGVKYEKFMLDEKTVAANDAAAQKLLAQQTLQAEAAKAAPKMLAQPQEM
jgi:hypothetical protein